MTRPATRRRQTFSPAAALGIGALLLGGAYAASTAVFSARTQDVTDQTVQRLTAPFQDSDLIKIEKNDYKKGFASSTQTLTLAVGEPQDEPLRVIVTNHIKHGPLLGAAGIGQAVVDTEVRLADPAAQAELDKALGGKKPTIHTVVGLGGDSTTRINVPRGQFADTADSGLLIWQPLDGEVRAADLKTSADLTWKGLQLSAPETTFNLGEIHYVGNQSRRSESDALGAGKAQLTLGTLDVGAKGQQMRFRQVAVNTDNVPQGDFRDLKVQYNIGELSGMGQNLKDLKLHLTLGHLADAPLGRLMTFVQQMQRTAQAGTNLDTTPEQEKQLQTDLLALLRGQPVVTLERLSLRQPSGEITLTGRAALEGMQNMTLAELEQSGNGSLLQKLTAQLKVQGSEQAMQELAAQFGQQASAQNLLDGGSFQKVGSDLVSTFEMKGGQMFLNGQPMN